MGHYLVLVVLWATVIHVTLELQLTEKEMKDMKGKFCGTHLSNMLSLVCDGVYNKDPYKKQKKNMHTNNLQDHNNYEDNELAEYFEDQSLLFPFRSRERAKSMIQFGFRKRTADKKGDNTNDQEKQIGVVDECCYKSCSIWEMHGYCGK